MIKIINQSQATSKYTLPDQTEKEYTVKSNESTILYMTEAFKKERSSAKLFGEPKEEIEQTLILTNDTDYPITNVSVQETIGSGAKFKAGSVTIDDNPQITFDVTTGYTLPNEISAHSNVTIKYMIVIDDSPSESSVEFDTLVTYSINEAVDLQEHANLITLDLEENIIEITQESDKTAVISGDKILFQNVIENKGNLKNTEITFLNSLPAELEFVIGSVKIDNVEKVGFNPTVGFKIDDLTPGQQTTITYEVTVK